MNHVLTYVLIGAASCLLLAASFLLVIDRTGKKGGAYNALIIIVKALSVCVALVLLTLLALKSIDGTYGLIQFGLTVVVSFTLALTLKITRQNK